MKFLVIFGGVVVVAEVVCGDVVNLKWSKSVGTKPFRLTFCVVVDGVLVVVGIDVVVGGGRTVHREHREQKYRRM